MVYRQATPTEEVPIGNICPNSMKLVIVAECSVLFDIHRVVIKSEETVPT